MMKKNLLFLLALILACSTPNDNGEPGGLAGLELGGFRGLVGDDPNTGLYEQLSGLAQFELEPADTIFSFIFSSPVFGDTTVTEVALQTKSLELPEIGTYSFNNIEDTTEVYANGFSGFYLSPSVGLGEQYFSESGTLTITSSESVNGIAGYFEAVIFYNAQTGEDEYTRQYSTISGEFNAAPMNFR